MAGNKIIFIILFIVLHRSAAAQGDDHIFMPPSAPSRLQVSLITGSPGEELWETFGHACFRVIDSSKTDGERDVIYNYGFFDAAEGDIGYQFLTKRVSVFLDTITYEELITEYVSKKRGLTEQVLILDNHQKERIVSFLKKNLKKENRYYEYDSFFDNCTTRVRDMFFSVFDSGFVAGQVIPANSRLTFRDASINKYCPAQHKYWFGLGLNIFYAGSIDRIMNNNEAMFLPAYLSNGLRDATVNGMKICSEEKIILEDQVPLTSKPDWPLIICLILATATIVGLLQKKYIVLSNMAGLPVLVVTGFLGMVILYTWFLDGEPAWRNNLNILWALPTNIIIPFFSVKFKAKYAIVALCLIGCSLIFDILKVQEIPLLEITPLLLALVWTYATMYLNNRK